jgi:hypothetical protein
MKRAATPTGSEKRRPSAGVPKPASLPEEGDLGPSRSGSSTLDFEHLHQASRAELRVLWGRELGYPAPQTLGRDVLILGIAYRRQEQRYGGLAKPVARELERLLDQVLRPPRRSMSTSKPFDLPRIGATLVREWGGVPHHVMVTQSGFVWNGRSYSSLSTIAHAITGTRWNGPRFFGLRPESSDKRKTSHGSS